MNDYKMAIESNIEFIKEMIVNCEKNIIHLLKKRPTYLRLPIEYMNEEIIKLLKLREKYKDELYDAIQELRRVKKEMYSFRNCL